MVMETFEELCGGSCGCNSMYERVYESDLDDVNYFRIENPIEIDKHVNPEAYIQRIQELHKSGLDHYEGLLEDILYLNQCNIKTPPLEEVLSPQAYDVMFPERAIASMSSYSNGGILPTANGYSNSPFSLNDCSSRDMDSAAYQELVTKANNNPFYLETHLEESLGEMRNPVNCLVEKHGVKDLDSIATFSESTKGVLEDYPMEVFESVPNLSEHATVPEFGGHLAHAILSLKSYIPQLENTVQEKAAETAGYGDLGIVLPLAIGGAIIGGRLLGKKIKLGMDDLYYGYKAKAVK